MIELRLSDCQSFAIVQDLFGNSTCRRCLFKPTMMLLFLWSEILHFGGERKAALTSSWGGSFDCNMGSAQKCSVLNWLLEGTVIYHGHKKTTTNWYTNKNVMHQQDDNTQEHKNMSRITGALIYSLAHFLHLPRTCQELPCWPPSSRTTCREQKKIIPSSKQRKSSIR